MPANTMGRMRKVFRPRGIEADGLKYYQERNKAGDYVGVDPSTYDYFARIGQPGMLEGRATAIHGYDVPFDRDYIRLNRAQLNGEVAA